MGDRTSVTITIGGQLPRSLAPELAQILIADGMDMIEWSHLSENEIIEHLLKGGDDVEFNGQEINYGNIDGTEEWLQEHDLFYRMSWEPGGGYGAGEKIFDLISKIGGHGPLWLNTNDGDTCLTDAEIRELGSYEAVIARLDRAAQPVPPLEIVEG